MTDISKEAVDALLQGVTADWEHDEETARVLYPGGIVCDVYSEDQDARFIAAARELVPAQAAEIERIAAEENRLCAEIKRLGDLLVKAEAERDAANALLRRWESYGCPDCGGDCASANPPITCCIMQETYAHLGAKP